MIGVLDWNCDWGLGLMIGHSDWRLGLGIRMGNGIEIVMQIEYHNGVVWVVCWFLTEYIANPSFN